MTLWTVPRQAPLSMGFPRQEYWNGLPCPFSGDLPGPGIEHTSPMSPALAGGLFTASSTWEAHIFINLDVISPNDSSVLYLAKLLLHPFKFSSDIPSLRSFSNVCGACQILAGTLYLSLRLDLEFELSCLFGRYFFCCFFH